MAVIQELSSHLADLIAAGEVVERPSSVAKELVENAIDAGATRIQVEIENGGITYLRIMDNGCGMTSEDAPVAFRRHATSKLRTEADLSAIGTLGFRGEALAAIAAVSRIDLFTKQKDILVGQHLHLEAGELQVQEEAGCPDGTTIIIRDLFFNTPARMKFLKKDFTEAGYVIGVVQHAALSHPEIAFSMVRDGKQVFSSAGDGKLMTPVFGVFGREITANMIEINPFERDAVTVWGYVTKPHCCRPNRSMQHFFVNGRYIKSKLLQAAVEEAFRNKIITGKYPSCALFLRLPLNQVDVNVHPAKTEVKFAHEKSIFEATYIACKNSLEQNDNIPLLKLTETKKAAHKEDNLTSEQQHITIQETVEASQRKTASPLQGAIRQPFSKKMAVMSPKFCPPIIDCDEEDDVLSLASPEISSAPSPLSGIQKMPLSMHSEPAQTLIGRASQPTPQFCKLPQSDACVPEPKARVIGEAFCTYIVAEDEAGLVLLDKHAAHERMLFNKLRTTANIPQQQLVMPYIAELSATEFEALKNGYEAVKATGFALEPFGEHSFAIRAVPAYLDAGDIPDVLSEIAEKLLSNRAPTPDRLDDLIHTVACKAAIKAGRHTSQMELQQLCDCVLGDPEISCCPHGRPVTVRLTKYEIDKLFKRVNQ